LYDFSPPIPFLAILHSIFCPISPLLMMILTKTQLAKDGVQNRSKKRWGCKIAQITKDRGKVQLSYEEDYIFYC